MKGKAEFNRFAGLFILAGIALIIVGIANTRPLIIVGIALIVLSLIALFKK